MSCRGLLGTCLTVLLAALASGCGGSDPAPERRGDPFTAVEAEERSAHDRSVAAAAPRWERVTRLHGTQDARHAVRIDRGAVQWRARWRCREGSFALRAAGRSLARAACPKRGVAEDVGHGRIALDVTAGGPWQVTVDQQVTTALHVPPLAAMEAPGARVLARGRFRPIERRGSGRAELHRLADGRLAVRLEGFATAPNTDLFVWASRARAPATTRQALRAPYVEVAPLAATRGDHNYVLPRGISEDAVRSIVIWCAPLRIAYTAAALQR